MGGAAPEKGNRYATHGNLPEKIAPPEKKNFINHQSGSAGGMRNQGGRGPSWGGFLGGPGLGKPDARGGRGTSL